MMKNKTDKILKQKLYFTIAAIILFTLTVSQAGTVNNGTSLYSEKPFLPFSHSADCQTLGSTQSQKAIASAVTLPGGSGFSSNLDPASLAEGDLDGDGDCDIYDFADFTLLWLSNDPNADFNASGFVDLEDLSIFSQNYEGLTGRIDPDDQFIQYTGRVVFDDPKAPMLYWPGISIVANFQGTSIKVRLNDYGDNYFYAFVDDAEPLLIDCTPGPAVYDIAEDLEDTVHKIQLYRRTEDRDGPTAFNGFRINPGKKLVPPPPRPQRKIEFYGDSITVGLALESDSDDQSAQFTNNYLSYGALTARYFNAEFHCIAKSGIGILKSWFPEIMPEYYYRHDPTDPDRRWDFTQWIPDVVVINLGQNDYWLLPKKTTDEEIITAYVDFIQAIRTEYTDAYIIMALGNMNATQEGSEWPGYIESAVEIMNTTHADPKVYSIIFPYKETSGHPDASEHQDMADLLIPFIQTTVGW